MVTIQTVGRLIQSSRAKSGLRGSGLVLLGLSMLLGALLANPGVLGMSPQWGGALAQLLFLAILGLLVRWAWSQRRLSRLLIEVFEVVQLQRWEQAEPMLERILSGPVRHPQVRCELLLSLAMLAEARGAYDAAQRIFEVVLEENRGDALQLHTVRAALAAVMLRTGQTTDAITLIDRLTRAEIPEPLKAQVELVSLFRELVMGQSQDNLSAAGERRRLFRDHLSTRAAYGYGLLAAAFDRANQPVEAERYWHDATLLVCPEELLGRFRELESVAARYPRAAEVALRGALGVDGLLRVFRRNLTVIQLLRAAGLAAFVAAMMWTVTAPGGGGRPVLGMFAVAALAVWVGSFARSVWLVREMQASNWLMAYGRLDDAEARLGRTLAKFSLSARAQIALLQQLAGLLFRRDRYGDVVAICRELLRHRLGQFRGLMFNTRVLLADSLLLLERVDEAYSAMRPVYNTPLSLADRMRLLPVQLRYELAAGHAAAAAGALADKVRVAELLDSPRAALVHALLAEACRRQAMPAQQAFLAERARLYHDLGPLAERYPLIREIATSEAPASEETPEIEN